MVSQSDSRIARRRKLTVGATVLVVGVMTLAACNPKSATAAGKSTATAAGSSTSTASASTDSSASSTDTSSASATTSTSAGASSAITLTPATGATGVSPAAAVTASVGSGHLTDVTLTNATGTSVTGTMDASSMTWKASEALGYGKTYTLTAKSVDSSGTQQTQTSSFTTLTPSNQTKVYLNTTGGQALQNGATYGVGIVVVAHFDEAVSDRKAAEQALQVTTAPAVTGNWYWTDNQNAHWRPQNYYATGTQVTVNANVYGVQVGPGLYGQEDDSVSFKIGDKHVSIADDNTHQVQVFFNDQLVRTMPTSMGKGGSQVVNGLTISYWTQRGTYTVIGQGNPVIMDSSTYGLPINAKGGYREPIYWATRISTDGVFLHELDSTVWAQGSRDLSHGCLNLNKANAQWFYQNAQIGDVVQVVNTGGTPLEIWQNGDWSVPWATWQAGSALA